MRLTQKELQQHLSKWDFFELAKKTRHPKVHIRLLALGHLKTGKRRKEIAEMFQITTETIKQWVRKFVEIGLEALQEVPGRGRKRKLSQDKEEDFKQSLEKLQDERPGGRVRGEDVRVLLKEKFSADYALPSVYHVLERCGFSWISARSKHPKADAVAQEDFKMSFKKK